MVSKSLLTTVVLLLIQFTHASTDLLWLRYTPLPKNYPQYISAHIQADETSCKSKIQIKQLNAAASEITLGLTKMYNTTIQATCCGCANPDKTISPHALLISIDTTRIKDLTNEGFQFTNNNTITTATSSGALYATFHLLNLLQRKQIIPNSYTSIPAMKHRMWDLWDGLNGQVTRGFAGASLIWPYALYPDSLAPPRTNVFVTNCNASDPYQQWTGDTFLHSNTPSVVHNNRNNNKNTHTCLSTLIRADPSQTTEDCNATTAALFLYNHTNHTISVTRPSKGWSASTNPHGAIGCCLDLNGGSGPDVDMWECHRPSNLDYKHQNFVYNTKTFQISPLAHKDMCLTLDRTTPIPNDNDITDPWNGNWKIRFEQFMKLMKSSGMNSLVLQDVNACGPDNTKSLNDTYIDIIATNVAPIMTKWGITPFQSVCFGAPTELNQITSNPNNKETQKWWNSKLKHIQNAWSKNDNSQFGGFLVKADSEGNIGPMMFNLTEADGANMIANEMPPGMILIWRAFVYGMYNDEDLARQSYDTFHQLDGKFSDNVILQIKNGPMDFQIREPLHPLLGSMLETPVMMEVQAAQEYTGQQIHMTNLVTMWKEYLEFDTKWNTDSIGPTSIGPTIAALLTGGVGTDRAHLGKGMACISNLGTFANWTGHVMAQSNFYGCGRLQWNPFQSASDINREWIELTFSNIETSAHSAIHQMVQSSRDIYEGYHSPLGIGFIIDGNPNTNGCAPKTHGQIDPKTNKPGRGPKGMICPAESCHGCTQPMHGGNGARSDHYWLNPCQNYDFGNYSKEAIGCYRGNMKQGGTGYATMYSPAVQKDLENLDLIDEDLLLFFHNVKWDYVLRSKNDPITNESRTVWEHIALGHYEAVERCNVELLNVWKELKNQMPEDDRWLKVLQRLQQQCWDGKLFAETIVGWYANYTGLNVPSGSASSSYVVSDNTEQENISSSSSSSSSYVVSVVNRIITGKPLIYNTTETDPFSKTACGGDPCTNVLNPAWLPFPTRNPNGIDCGLFVRLSTPGCYPSVIALLPGNGTHFERPSDAHVLHDGPKGTGQEMALADDPRAVYRPLTGTYYVTYQTAWEDRNGHYTRRTTISSSKKPSDISSWKRFSNSMFSTDDCGTALWFPDDVNPTIKHKKAYAIATFGTLRGGNLTLVTSDDDMQTWRNVSMLLTTRSNAYWDNATLSSGPSPVQLEDGNWLFLYNVDNLFPVAHPVQPFPYYGRCALGYVILDQHNYTKVLGRSNEPLVYAQLPWELNGTTNQVVYTDGIRSDGGNLFTVFAGGGDSVVEAFQIHVKKNTDGGYEQVEKLN